MPASSSGSRCPKLGEGGQVQLRFEGFNIFNHPNFGTPNGNISTAGAGSITTLTTGMRVLQAGLKVVFFSNTG